jgi:hypothetical protein
MADISSTPTTGDNVITSYRTTSPHKSISVTQPQPQPSRNNKHTTHTVDTEVLSNWYVSPDWWVAGFTGALVLVTAGLWFFTYRLWKTTQEAVNDSRAAIGAAERGVDLALEANRIAERDMLLSKRPFVFFGSPYRMALYDEADETKLIGWRFAPVWENAGFTPTRHMTSFSFTQYFANGVPTDFVFGSAVDPVVRRNYIGPQSTRQTEYID